MFWLGEPRDRISQLFIVDPINRFPTRAPSMPQRVCREPQTPTHRDPPEHHTHTSLRTHTFHGSARAESPHRQQPTDPDPPRHAAAPPACAIQGRVLDPTDAAGSPDARLSTTWAPLLYDPLLYNNSHYSVVGSGATGRITSAVSSETTKEGPSAVSSVSRKAHGL